MKTVFEVDKVESLTLSAQITFGRFGALGRSRERVRFYVVKRTSLDVRYLRAVRCTRYFVCTI